MTRQRWLRHTARLPPIHSAVPAGMPVRSTALRLRSGLHQCGEPGRRLVEQIYPLVAEGIAWRFVPAEPKLEHVQAAVLRVRGGVRAGIRRNGSCVTAAIARCAEYPYLSVRVRPQDGADAPSQSTCGWPPLTLIFCNFPFAAKAIQRLVVTPGRLTYANAALAYANAP